MDCLWVQIKKLEDNDWIEKQLNKPYEAITKSRSPSLVNTFFNLFVHSFVNSLAHDFPMVVLPQHNEKTIFPIPRVVFRMFDYTDVPEVIQFQQIIITIINFIKIHYFKGIHSAGCSLNRTLSGRRTTPHSS